MVLYASCCQCQNVQSVTSVRKCILLNSEVVYSSTVSVRKEGCGAKLKCEVVAKRSFFKSCVKVN